MSRTLFRKLKTDHWVQAAVDGVIDRMDDYFLNKEDWDAIVEMGLDQFSDTIVNKKITAVTKTALTRK